MSLPLQSDGTAIPPVTNDLGYEVRLARARISARALQFTVRGEEHSAWWRRLAEVALPTAHAHPGHLAGGEVTGELPGEVTLVFGAGEPTALGEAILLPGHYEGMNLGFGSALEGAVTAVLEGTATRGGEPVAFTARLEIAPGSNVVGIPFDALVAEATRGTLNLRLLPKDPHGAGTLFDLIDFARLDPDGDGQMAIEPGSSEANAMRRALQSHAFYEVHLVEE